MESQESRSLRIPQSLSIFATIFCAIWLLHGPLLRLPYFWDEAGYFVPAAHEDHVLQLDRLLAAAPAAV